MRWEQKYLYSKHNILYNIDVFFYLGLIRDELTPHLAMGSPDRPVCITQVIDETRTEVSTFHPSEMEKYFTIVTLCKLHGQILKWYKLNIQYTEMQVFGKFPDFSKFYKKFCDFQKFCPVEKNSRVCFSRRSFEHFRKFLTRVIDISDI